MMVIKHTASLFFILCCWPLLTTAFLLDNTCFVSPPCRCVPGGADCADMDLQSMPLFDLANWTSPTLSIDLHNNNISQVDDYSFMNIDVDGKADIHLNFRENSISSMSDYSFDGVENSVTIIDLTDNLLTSIPKALGNLTNLNELYIDNNPLMMLDLATMTMIGKELLILDMDMSSFTSWPSKLRELVVLQSMTLHGIQLLTLPNDAFNGLESDLKSMSILESGLTELPKALCSLTNLTELIFVGDSHVTNNILHVDTCLPASLGTSNKIRINLRNNSLIRFPKILNTASAYNVIDVGNNNLQFIDERVIPKCNVSTLILDHNGFVRIPNALNNLEYIHELNLGFNQIASIEDTDVKNMMHLSRLFLENNKIEYIHPRALSTTSLKSLNLENNKLKTLPETIKYVSPMAMVNLMGNVVDCSCLKFDATAWNKTNIVLKGKCETGTELLQTFISTAPQMCPF